MGASCSPAAEAQTLHGDDDAPLGGGLDGDRDVYPSDLGILLADWGCPGS